MPDEIKKMMDEILSKTSNEDFSENIEKRLKELNNINNLKYLSMGMSGDFKVAIKFGSNFVRIGSAIFN